MREIISNKRLSDWLNLKSWRPYFIIFTLGFLLYSQTLWFGFTYFDDDVLVLNNAPVLQNIKNIGAVFSNDVFSGNAKLYYRPLLNISLMFDAQIGGTSPFVYHLDNILLHIIATSLIFYLLFLLTKRKNLAFCLSVFFLVHPVISQAIAWIPGRNDSLLAIFVISSFIFFLSFLERPRLLSYLAYLFFLFLALLTKETALVLPILVIFYLLFIDRKNSSKPNLFLLIFGSAAVEFIWFLMRSLAINNSTTINTISPFSFIEKIPGAVVNIGKLLFPFNLSIFPTLRDSTLFYGISVLVILITILILSKQRRNNYIIFGCLWFFIFYFPSFILKSSPDFFINFLEHRLYLSFFGFLIVISEVDWIKNLNFDRRIIQVGGIAILIIFATITFCHSRGFSNSLVFWQTAVRTSPHSAEIQKNLGLEYYDINDYTKAEYHYNLALALNNLEPKLHNNLGILYTDQGKYNLAKKEFEKELEISFNNEQIMQTVKNNLQILDNRQNLLK